MINRTIYKEIIDTIKNKAVTVITGARQVGKTTLCSLIETELGFNYVSLADPIIRNSAKSDPSEFLSLNTFPLIIDEIQKAPELFEYLEGIVDKEIKKGNKKGLYVLTGSQAYKLMKGVTESMAGRVGLISMSPLSLSEITNKEELPFEVDIQRIKNRTKDYLIDTNKMYEYIVRGFYPELYDNTNLKTSIFYADYVETYLERDVSDFINLKDKQKFLNLMSVLASLTGQELIYDNLSKIIGVDVKTIQSWISVLIAGNIIYLLYPYNEESMVKQVTKRPKIYYGDTGLACYLARVTTSETLKASYLKGHMVETFIVNEIIKSYKNNRYEKETSFYYYRNSNQEEIDLIIVRDGKISLIECKSGEEFNSKDVSSFDNLSKTRLEMTNNAIICTTKNIYSIGKGIYVIPVTSI
ncbi:MAG: ATP-binding protein [Acholeplasmatales bacterium]|nr:ATP-binding protein [Acholeplasmatales bacterium]